MDCISLRETFRAVENYIVLEIIGSKREMKNNSLYTVKNLQKIAQEEKSIQSKIEGSRWNSDFSRLVQLIEFFKKTGDVLVHDKIPSKSELLKYLLDCEDSTLDDADKSLVESLFIALDAFCKKEGQPFGKGPFFRPIKKQTIPDAMPSTKDPIAFE